MATKVLHVPLSQSQQRTAELFVRGLSVPQAAGALGLSSRTVAGHAGALRIKLGVPARCALHVLVHALIGAGLATVPAPDRAAPSLGRTQLRLLRAAAEHARLTDVARAAKTHPTEVAAGVGTLLQATDAEDLTQPVILAHGWELLTPGQRCAVDGSGLMNGHGNDSTRPFTGTLSARLLPEPRPATCAARQADTGSWPLGVALAAAGGRIPFVFLVGEA
ncbi:LuxR C-terminal-related transcriptional regulator [Streptomyces rubradiris]|uniref:LuxR C-terminal-related transcriptional regulator n=1 Tax=Streptomyces rubradiris TaxID=285531 RepID=UPI0036E4FA29